MVMPVPELRGAIAAGDTSTVEGWTADLLTEIVHGRHELAAVRHPLGFHCLPVRRSGGDGICVRNERRRTQKRRKQ